MDQTVRTAGLFANISPEAFHRWARHYLKCKQDFQSPDGFSPVPYFLLCRALELEIKSRHLQSKNQLQVKKDFGHDIFKAYDALEQAQKILSADEVDVLRKASSINNDKGFEYFNPEHALKGYSNFPDLEALDAISRKLVS